MKTNGMGCRVEDRRAKIAVRPPVKKVVNTIEVTQVDSKKNILFETWRQKTCCFCISILVVVCACIIGGWYAVEIQNVSTNITTI